MAVKKKLREIVNEEQEAENKWFNTSSGCPNCGTWIHIVEVRRYEVKESTTADYERYECPACLWTLHRYYPPTQQDLDNGLIPF